MDVFSARYSVTLRNSAYLSKGELRRSSNYIKVSSKHPHFNSTVAIYQAKWGVYRPLSTVTAAHVKASEFQCRLLTVQRIKRFTSKLPYSVISWLFLLLGILDLELNPKTNCSRNFAIVFSTKG